ncbi:MAG: MFS transporter [Balneolaceae bacterium]
MTKTDNYSKKGLFSWALYDWANSAFFVMIQTFIFAAYFTSSIAENETTGTAQWGFTIGLAGFAIAVLAPILGSIADVGGPRKPWVYFFAGISIISTSLLWFAEPSLDFLTYSLVLAFFGTVGAELSLIFYNAMLPDLSPPDKIGRWSGWGWSLGFAGGIVCLVFGYFVLFLNGASLFGLDESMAEHTRSTFLFTGIWYALFMIPFILKTSDLPSRRKTYNQAVTDGFSTLWIGLKMLRKEKDIFKFLVARLFYNDALVTIFAMGGVYAAGSFGFETADIFYFGIALNLTAGLGAYGFAWLDDKSGSKRTIMISLIGLIIPVVAVIFVKSVLWFWIWGLFLGVFVGPVQAASRTLMGRMAPKEKRNQMYGLFALSGKVTSFAGPMLMGWITLIMDNQRWGMGVILVMLVIGLVLMLGVKEVSVDQHEFAN